MVLPRQKPPTAGREALATPAGNRGRPKPLPNALEPVPCNSRSRLESQSSALGSRGSARSTARSSDPAWRTARSTCFGPHPGIPANIHHASNRSTRQVLSRIPAPLARFPPAEKKLTFVQMLHLAGMMPRHLLLLYALILAFSSSAQSFSGAVTDDGRGLTRRLHHRQKPCRRRARRRQSS